MQLITVDRRRGLRACDKECERYNRGYTITLNLADPADANLARYIREGKAGRAVEVPMLVEGAVEFQFPPGQCPGHQLSWQDDPAYFAGVRRTVHDEWHERYAVGAEALVAARTRLQERKE